MNIVWIVDNKYRELYGLYDLKKKLHKANINLHLIHKFSWKIGIDFFNPEVVIIPNLAPTSCAPILKYAFDKNIRVYLHTSESLFYEDNIQKDKYPLNLIKKVSKVLLWSHEDGKFLKKKGFKNKLYLSGGLKFDKSQYKNFKKKDAKIKIVGIPTSLRYITSNVNINVPLNIRDAVEKKQQWKIGFIKDEVQYSELISKIINELIKNKIKVIIKAHPLESADIYRQAFPEVEVTTDFDVRNFLKKVDLILNFRSSIAVEAIKFQVPVIKLDSCLILNKDFTHPPPIKIGLDSKNISQLMNLILKNTRKKLYTKCIKKGDFKETEKLASSINSLEAFYYLFKQTIRESKRMNFFYVFKYIFVEIRQFFFRKKRKQLYLWWNLKDQKLLKHFRL